MRNPICPFILINLNFSSSKDILGQVVEKKYYVTGLRTDMQTDIGQKDDQKSLLVRLDHVR